MLSNLFLSCSIKTENQYSNTRINYSKVRVLENCVQSSSTRVLDAGITRAKIYSIWWNTSELTNLIICCSFTVVAWRKYWMSQHHVLLEQISIWKAILAFWTEPEGGRLGCCATAVLFWDLDSILVLFWSFNSGFGFSLH